MTGLARLAIVALALSARPHDAPAQEFQPPDQRRASPAGGGSVRLGLLGFSTRGGGQVNRDGQGVLGSTVDIATLGSPQVRLRPSFEAGVGGGGSRSLHIAAEVVYRFQPDQAEAIPYVGAGLGWYEAGSGDASLFPNLVMGFELRFRPQFNWLVEYHALDRMGRHRFLVGLATRAPSP